MAMLTEILDRRSIATFKPSPVSAAKLERVLEAGRLAPSAKNRQEWRFIVIGEEGAAGEHPRGRFRGGEGRPGPGGYRLVHNQHRIPHAQRRAPPYPVDIGIAAGFMALQAVHEGLGTCLLGTFDEQAVKELIDRALFDESRAPAVVRPPRRDP